MLLINDEPLNYFKFPGGEIQVKVSPEINKERVIITWKPTNSDEIMLLLLAANALHHMMIYDIELDALYLPYERQDRVCSSGEAFSLELICDLISRCGFTHIRVWDLHNPSKTIFLLNHVNISHIEVYQIFRTYGILDSLDKSKIILCSPDKGALHRAQVLRRTSSINTLIEINKNREPSSGKIISMKIDSNNELIKDSDILLIDDICDGGATFVEAAKLLQNDKASNLYLYVTHGIFSQGLDELLKYYKHIYCHHVLDDEKFKSNENLTILREN